MKLWVLIKKFKIAPDSELLYQIALVEREIDQILSASFNILSDQQSDSKPTADAVSQKLNEGNLFLSLSISFFGLPYSE